MKTKTKKLVILKKHVGASVDFTGWNRHEGIVCQGKIASVQNGFAKLVEVNFPGAGGGSGFETTISVREAKIVAIHV